MRSTMIAPCLLERNLLGIVILGIVWSSSAFTSIARTTRLVSGRVSLAIMSVELVPEPDGGEELLATLSMPGCRVKMMQEVKPSKGNDVAYQFWMTAIADGKLVQEIRTQILKDASKKANFPGFRKGQVPPYAQAKVTHFALQEGIIKTVEAVVEAYGLKSLPGSEGEVTVHEEVEEMAKMYKSGDSIPFTATLKAGLNPNKPLMKAGGATTPVTSPEPIESTTPAAE